MKRTHESFGFAFILNMLCPGLGHAYWREYLFAAFVFLVYLLAATLFFTALLVGLPLAVKVVLFALPLLFYLITFVDLARTVKKRKHAQPTKARLAVVFLVIAVAFQLAAPIAPANYILRNAPEVFAVRTGDYAPWMSRGDWAVASALSLRANVFFLDRPIWLSVPDYGDIIRFSDGPGSRRMGVVLGISGDQVRISDGSLYVDGVLIPGVLDRLHLRDQYLPLTSADVGSILVATMKLGAVDEIHQVSLQNVVGIVYRLF